MQKKVTDLEAEEIAKLFPVVLSPFNIEWKSLYDNEKNLIVKSLGDLISRIEHFGSTSIPNLISKDTIDILAEIDIKNFGSEEIIGRLKLLGYDYILQNEGTVPHMIFVKGYGAKGEKDQTFHIHMGPKQHEIWDRIFFRDYLIQKPEFAKAYEKLKLKLAEEFKYDRVGYRIAKTEFIRAVTLEAKEYYLK